MMAYKGISLRDVFLLSLHLLPATLTVATAWGFAIALIWVYQRWKGEKAFDVMFSCGISPWFFNQVAVFLALILTGMLYFVTVYVSPTAKAISRRHELMIKNRFDPSFITSGVFFTLQNRVIYAHRHPSRYRLGGIFLYDYHNPRNEFIVLGQSADITPHDQGFCLRFHNGSMQAFPKNRPPYLAQFKSYTLNYQKPSQGAPGQREESKPQDQSLPTLWKRYTATEPKACRDAIKKELSYRILWPLTPLVDALWIPWILLSGGPVTWPLFFCLLILHAGMLSPWSLLALACALCMRCGIWYGAVQKNRDNKAIAKKNHTRNKKGTP